MANPPWPEVARQIAVPQIRMDKDYFLLFITMVGTTITPYMQFYLQSAVVDKGVRIEEYGIAKFDVYAGSFMTVFIAFFIILATGTILHPAGVVGRFRRGCRAGSGAACREFRFPSVRHRAPERIVPGGLRAAAGHGLRPVRSLRLGVGHQ